MAKMAKLDDGSVTMTGNTVTVQTTSASASENGIPITTIKTEKADTSSSGAMTNVSGTPGKLETSATGGTPSKQKAKSQSEQPATCPICSAVIRQSRNLRRHLELRHFKKQGTKKSKKAQQQAQAQQAQVKQEVLDQTGEASTSGQGQTIVTVTGNQLADGTVVTSQPQQVVMSENADGTTSLSIAHVQTLSGQTLSLANLNQVSRTCKIVSSAI